MPKPQYRKVFSEMLDQLKFPYIHHWYNQSLLWRANIYWLTKALNLWAYTIHSWSLSYTVKCTPSNFYCVTKITKLSTISGDWPFNFIPGQSSAICLLICTSLAFNLLSSISLPLISLNPLCTQYLQNCQRTELLPKYFL